MARRRVCGCPARQRHQPSSMTRQSLSKRQASGADGGPSPGERPQIGLLVAKRAAIGLGPPGHELRAGCHLGIGFPFGITATVEANGSANNPCEQVEANEFSVLQASADGEVVPPGRVADVLERVLVLVGPEIMDVVKRGSRA